MLRMSPVCLSGCAEAVCCTAVTLRMGSQTAVHAHRGHKTRDTRDDDARNSGGSRQPTVRWLGQSDRERQNRRGKPLTRSTSTEEPTKPYDHIVRTIFAIPASLVASFAQITAAIWSGKDIRGGENPMALWQDQAQDVSRPADIGKPILMPREPVLNIRGDSVGLGPLSPDLLPVYQQWLNDFELLATLDRRFRPLTTDWIRTWYERQSRASGDSLVFTIWDLASTTPIGNVALQDIDNRSRTAEFGIFIAEPTFRGQGRGSEATRMMMRFAFDTLALDNVMLRVFAYNEAAIKVYERVGFRVIGHRRGAQRRNGRAWDVILMDITRDDYLAHGGGDT